MTSLIEKIDLPGFDLVQLKVQYRDIRVHVPTTNPFSSIQKRFEWEVEFIQRGYDSRYNPGHLSILPPHLPSLIEQLELAKEKMSRISALESIPEIVMPIEAGPASVRDFQTKMEVRAAKSVVWLDFYVRFPVSIDAKALDLCIERLRDTPSRAETLKQTLDLLS